MRGKRMGIIVASWYEGEEDVRMKSDIGTSVTQEPAASARNPRSARGIQQGCSEATFVNVYAGERSDAWIRHEGSHQESGGQLMAERP